MKETAKTVVKSAKIGTLCVRDYEHGTAFGALVNVATDLTGWPVFLLSTLARHTKSIIADPQASLLVCELPAEGDPLTGFRATLTGQMEQVGDDFRETYLARHPYAEIYVGFGDFNFWRLRPSMIYVVAGFGQIQSFKATEVFG